MTSGIKSRVAEIDIARCVQQSGGNKFDLAIMAAERAREIRRANSTSLKHEHLHPAITALLEFQNGIIGSEYIARIK
jgi:DNA-directed RNA polymerase subunit K/omega